MLWERGENKPRLKRRDTYRASHDSVDVTIVQNVSYWYYLHLVVPVIEYRYEKNDP